MKSKGLLSLWKAAAFLLAVLLLAVPVLGAGEETTRVSVDSSGFQADEMADYPVISDDGRFVLFESAATNLVNDDHNGMWDIFLYDRNDGSTRRVSLGNTGVESNGDSLWVADISADGNLVVFQSDGTNLVSGDNNAATDIFLHDMSTGATKLLSADGMFVEGDDASYWPSISNDGRYVAFESYATNLIDDDTNNSLDIFVRDLDMGTITRVSVSSSGDQANGNSNRSRVASDGGFIVFQSSATNLVDDDTNGVSDVFIHNLSSGETSRVSVASDGAQGNGNSSNPSVSADGRYVAFESDATNLVDRDTNGRIDVFVHDMQTGETRRVSVSSDGIHGNGDSTHPSISADGRYVAFESVAGNLVPDDGSGMMDIFVHDLQTSTTRRVSVASDWTEANGASYAPSISGDGQFVAFASSASNLVSDDTNAMDDVFVRDTEDVTAPEVYSIMPLNDPHTNATSVSFLVNFTEPVSGVDVDDFELTTTIADASITGVSASQQSFTVTVSTGTGSGTLRLDVVDNDSILDAAGHPLGGPGAGNGDFVTGGEYQIDLGEFALSTPADGIVDQDTTVTIAWGDSFGATKYEYCYEETNNTPCAGGWSDAGMETSVTLYNLELNTRYFWNVRATTPRGTVYANGGTNRVFTTVAEPLDFDKTDPVTASVDQSTSLTLNWEPTIGVTRYEYCFDLVNDDNCGALWISTGKSTSANPVGLVAGKTYYWQVRARNSMGITYANDGTWWSFAVAPLPVGPALISPAANAILTDYDPLLDWADLTVVPDHYQVQVARASSFLPAVMEYDRNVTSSQFQIPDLLPPGKIYYWRVRGVNVSGQTGPWSAARVFKTGWLPPTLSSPDAGESLLTIRPVFDWDDVAGAAGYTLQISKYSNFSSLQLSANTTTSTYTPAVNLPGGTLFYWRVATTGVNGPSAWSIARSFTTGNPPTAPLLTAPAENSLNINYMPTLDWSTVTVSVGTTFQQYQLQLATNNTFTESVINETVSVLADSQFTFAYALNPNTKYYWHVRAFNTLGHYSAWSLTRSFRTAVAVPVLSSPADTALLDNKRPTLDWNDVGGATGYTLQISKVNTFATIQLSATLTTPVSTYTPTVDLPAGTLFYWRVRANAVNGPSAWSEVRSFTTANPASAPVLVSPIKNVLIATYMPTLDWLEAVPATGTTVTGYDFEIGTDSTFQNLHDGRYIAGSGNTEFTLTAPLSANRTCYWRVRSINNLGQYSAWSVGVFRTVILPPTLVSPNNGSSLLDVRPAFNWEDVDGATGYTLQVSKVNTFATYQLNVNLSGLTNSAYTPTVDWPAGTLFYWRVRANGTNGPSTWSAVRTFTTAAPPSVPLPVAPLNNALVTATTLTLDWSDSTLPAGRTLDHYLLEISLNADFSSVVRSVGVGVSQDAVPAGPLNPNTTYYWRVHAINDLSEYSAWSAVRSFRTAVLAPDLFNPSDTAELPTKRPAFDWDDVSGATGYTLQVSKVNTFATLQMTINLTGQANSAYTPTTDLPAGTLFYWRVRANAVNGPSAWSAVRSFTTANPPAVPVLAAPAINALTTDYTPFFDWNDVLAPAGMPLSYYRMEISTDSSFIPTIIVANPSASQYTLPDMLALDPNTKYYWRVQSINTSGQASAWSAARTFRTALSAPLLSTPTDAVALTDKRPSFDWDDTAGATGYTLQLATVNTFAVLKLSVNTVASVYNPSVDLSAGTLYYWRVRANGLNGPSAWSEVRSFTTANPPSVPVLAAPAANALVSTFTPLLDWNNVTVPVGTTFDHYELQIGYDSAFLSVVADANVYGLANSQYTTPGLSANTTYYWHVRSVNDAGQVSAWSAPRYFRTIYATPILLVPANGSSTTDRTPTLDWEDVPGVTQYTLQISTTSTFSTLLVNQTVTGTSFTRLTAFAPGTIYWRVRAIGPNGPSNWSVIRSLTIQ